VRPEIVPGSSFVWHASALGQAIAAHLPAPESRDMIEAATFVQYAKSTIMKKQDLSRRLDDVRKQGFALSISEAYDGDITVAAPVYDHADRPYAAVSIAVLASEKTPAYVRKHYAPVVVELARAVSATAGMQRPAPR
jgi:DNA-binding IclR family transcriptional regulator